MNKRTSAIIVFLLLCVACVAHALYYYPRLPAQIAHHFDTSGQPDVWGSKIQFLIIYLATIAVIAATFLGFGLALSKIPNSLISLPNKEYWLTPERRQQTLGYLLPRFFWLGSLALLLILDIFHQTVLLHLGKATKLSHFGLSIGIYLVITFAWCITIYKKFSKKQSQ